MHTKKLNASKKNKFPPPFLIQRPGVIIGIARTEGNANYRCNIRKKMYLISTTTFSQSQMSQTSRHHQYHRPHTFDRFLPQAPLNPCLHTLGFCTSAFLSLNCSNDPRTTSNSNRSKLRQSDNSVHCSSPSPNLTPHMVDCTPHHR